jgi:hypothetical protein
MRITTFILLVSLFASCDNSNHQNDQKANVIQKVNIIEKANVIESDLICKSVDEFTDKVLIRPTEVIFLNEDRGDMRSEWLSLYLVFDGVIGKLIPSNLILNANGIEGCVDEGATLDVIFENGEKTQLVNWNDFDCEGRNYFQLKNKEDLFKSSKIKALKYTNTRNYDSMIVKTNMDEKGSSYIMNTLLEIDKINNGEVRAALCKE